VPKVNTYPQFNAADRVPAAFGAVPAGLAAVSAMHKSDITGTEMTQFFGQARRPRKIPLWYQQSEPFEAADSLTGNRGLCYFPHLLAFSTPARRRGRHASARSTT